MMIALHKQARTKPAVRAEIAASTDSVNALARRYDITASPRPPPASRSRVNRCKIALTRHTSCKPPLRLHKKQSWCICAKHCCCPWMICWQ